MRSSTSWRPQVMVLEASPILAGSPTHSLGYLLVTRGIRFEYIGHTHGSKPCDEWVLPDMRVREILTYSPKWIPSVVGQIVRFWQFFIRCVATGLANRPKVVIANHYTVLLPAWIIAGFTRASLVYYAKEYTVLRDLLVRSWYLLLFLERFLVHRADYVVSVEPWRAQQQQRDWQLKRSIEVIENAALRSFGTGAVRRMKTYKEPLKVIYAGRIAPNTCIRELLAALPESGSVELILLGHVLPSYAQEFYRLLAEAQAKGTIVEYRGIVPYLDLGRVLADFDVGVTLYRGDRLNEQYCAPSKMYQYIAAGLACVLPDFPGPQRLVNQYGFAVKVNPTSPASIAAGLRRLHAPLFLDELKTKALETFENFLNYETQSRELVNYIVSECHRRSSKEINATTK